MSDAIEKLAAVVPSAYYDVVARIVPGASIIAAFMWVHKTSLDTVATRTGVRGAGLAAVAIGASYLLGLLLTPLGSLVCEGPIVVVAKLIPRSGLADLSSARLWKAIAEVDAYQPQAGATLAKMSAEAALCQNLLAGVLVVWLMSWNTLPLSVGLGATTLCAVNVLFRTVVLLRRVDELRRAAPSGITTG